MDAGQVLGFIGAFGANPAFWWMWESIGFFLFFLMRWSRGIGADKHIVLDDLENRLVVATKWVKKGKISWGKQKGRISQSEATLFKEQGFLSNHGVQLTTLNSSLPLKIVLQEVPHNPVGKYTKSKDGKVNFIPGKEYSINPNPRALEEHLGRETAKQLHSMNALGNQGLTMLIVCAVAGILGGYIAYPFVNPPHTIAATITTVTQTLSSAIHP